MTMILEGERTAEVFSPRSSRAAVPASQDESASVTGPLAEDTIGYAEGDLLQARALVGKHPDSPTALARLASSEFNFGNRVSASEAAQAVLKSDAVDAPAFIVASQVLLGLGEIGLAERALDAVFVSSAVGDSSRRTAATLAARVAAHQGDPVKALDLLAHSDGQAALALEGALLVEMGRYDDAIRVLRAALRDIPDAPDTLCNLGYAYAAAGSIRKAIRATTAAAVLAPADRTAGLNLAAMLLSQERSPEALAVIDRLADRHPDDIRLRLAAASVLHISGDTAAALRRLRRLKAVQATRDATPALREELDLDIFLLETPAKAPVDAFAAAAEALKRCDYRSMRIVSVLASAAQSTADLPTLEFAYNELCKRHDRTALLAVESRAAFLRFEFGRCLEVTTEWARQEPFSPDAHIIACYLLSLHAGSYAEAARIGLVGISRGIRSAQLRNNVAFALAMDARPDKASQILPDPSEYEPALATAGLIEAARGNPVQAIAMYEDCARQMRQRGEDALADLVSMYRILAEVVAGRAVSDHRLARFGDGAGADPRFAIAYNAIARESARQA